VTHQWFSFIDPYCAREQRAVVLTVKQVREYDRVPGASVFALVLEAMTSVAVLILCVGGPNFSTTSWPFYFVVFGMPTMADPLGYFC
jgi:hypothetical protein